MPWMPSERSTARGMSRLAFSRFFTHRCHRLESHQDENRDARLDEDEREAVRCSHRSCGRVELEVRRQLLGVVGVDRLHRGGVIVRVAQRERHRLPVFHLGNRIAVGVHLVLGDGRASRVELGLAVFEHRLLRDHVVDRCAVDQVVGLRPFGVTRAVRDRHHREHQERGDLDDVDDHVDARRSGHTAESDVRDAQREHDAEEEHEERAIEVAREGVRPELVEQVPAQDCGNSDHAARIDPVVEMARPPGHELGDAGELEGLGLRQERLLGEEVRRAGSRVELGELGVADRSRKAEQQCRHDPEPHRRARHRRAVEGLDLVGQPQERARRDERHRVDRQSREAQGASTGRGSAFGGSASLRSLSHV